MILSKLRRTKVLLPGLLVFAASGFAAPITVLNPSFEILPPGGLPNACGTNCSFSIAPIPDWMTIGAGDSGQFEPGPPATTTFFNFVPDGITIAYHSGVGGFSQDVGVTVEVGVPYVLTIDLGRRKGAPFTSGAELLAGSTVVATATGTAPSEGNFSTFTASFIGSAANAGEPITIRLTSSGFQSAFDNVRLIAVPEPGFMGIVGLGLAGLLAFVRRSRTA